MQPSPVLNTDNELAYAAVRYYHKETLNVAQSALDEVSRTKREFSHVPIKISNDGFVKIKKRIQKFRNEILQLASDDSNVENVYHVNMQFYPITKSSGNEVQK